MEALMKTEKRNGRTYYETECETCGVKKMVRKDNLKHNKKCRSCARKEPRTRRKVKHGHSGSKKHNKQPSPLYVRWDNMKKRCNNPNHKSYRYYGGKGITICEEWNDFQNFQKDLKDTFFEGATLDRIDPDKGYYKENCRWLSRSDNSKHRHGNYKG
jgi:hypothetical protein